MLNTSNGHRSRPATEKDGTWEVKKATTSSNHITWYCYYIVLAIITAPILLIGCESARAHVPHDVVDAVVVSPEYATDRTLFIIVRNNLRRSRDAGTSWKNLIQGLDNLHNYTSLAISRTAGDGTALFVATDGDGIFRSVDDGASWSRMNEGLDALKIAVIAAAPLSSGCMVLAAGDREGLFLYQDEHERWSRVPLHTTRITAISFARADGRIIVVGDESGLLHRSRNGGATWSRDSNLSEHGAITTIAHTPGPASRDTFFVGTDTGSVFRTTDGGNSFTDTSPKIGDGSITALAVSPRFDLDASVFAVRRDGTVVRSNDGGASWHEVGDKNLMTDQRADNLDRAQLSSLQVAETTDADLAIFAGGYDGLFRSIDSEKEWVELETLSARLIVEFDLSPHFQRDGSIATTTYDGGLFLTQDRGDTWTPITTGLKGTRYYDIEFSPNYEHDRTIISATWGPSISRSYNSGTSWDTVTPLATNTLLTRLKDGFRKAAPELYSWLGSLKYHWHQKLFHKSHVIRPGLLVLSPNFAHDSTIFLTTISGIYRSTDAASTVTALWTGISPRSLVVSPSFSTDRTLFVSIEGEAGGIYKSLDAGESWQQADDGIASKLKRIHLAISPEFAVDRTLFAGTVEGLFLSKDGGQTWGDITASFSNALSAPHVVNALAVSPNFANDRELIVSIKGRGLFKSSDGGAFFHEIAPELTSSNHGVSSMHAPRDEFTPIRYSPAYAIDTTIILSTTEELFRSVDAGNSWQRLSRPIRYENNKSNVTSYDGEWSPSILDDASGGSISYSDSIGSTATLQFVGTGVTIIGPQSDDLGISKVYLDNIIVAEVDHFSPTRKPLAVLHSVSGLDFRSHMLRIEVTGRRNEASRGHRIEIDAFDVRDSSSSLSSATLGAN